MTNPAPIYVIDRKTGEQFEETILGEKWIRWAYQNSESHFLERVLFRSSFISKLMGAWYDSSFSKGKIAPTIENLAIDESEFADATESYATFNDFFIRHLKEESRPFSDKKEDIVSPAEGRTLVFPKLDENTYIPVKGFPFSIKTMLPEIYERFTNGALAIIRLCPADYHRYHFPCTGTITQSVDIQGALHSVNPIALGSGPDVFGENKRTCTLIDTQDAGTMCFIEVGAFGVGSIVNTRTNGAVKKMDEKGFFKFGGSTVVVVFEQDRIQFSKDLVENSAAGKETLLKVGEPLATVIS